MESSILAPAAVLVLWSLVVLLWMTMVRFPAFKNAGVDPKTSPPGGRYADLESVMPAKVNWVSHNFTHLMEQPTLFYAVVVILALAGQGDGLNTTLAWGYVVLRILHSLWQILVNTIPVRLALFGLSTLCLLGLSVRAVMATL
tara:strand:- start:51056 stop:51484 length:429 start_codon:yes stop_codon:yes gene_type:complete